MSAAGLSSAPAITPRTTLADHLIPADLAQRIAGWQRDVLLVLGGTALLIVGAYVSFNVPSVAIGRVYLPENPFVPITLQTFGVLFTGALLGARRGVSATGLYLLLGVAGVPVFIAASDGSRAGLERFVSLDGGTLVFGATGGYLIGFLIASAVVGILAQRGWDRRVASSIGAMLLGSAIIYAIGLPWLAAALSVDPSRALVFGLWPFVPGDIAKLLIAAGLLPLGWRLVARRASERPGGPPQPS